MKIQILGDIPTADLAKEFSAAVEVLIASRVTSVSDVEIVFRALEDDRECYSPGAGGKHMGFVLERVSMPDATSDTRRLTWDVPGSAPEPINRESHWAEAFFSSSAETDEPKTGATSGARHGVAHWRPQSRQVAELWGLAHTRFPKPDAAFRFLNTPYSRLGEATPVEFAMRSPRNFEMVLQLLRGAVTGVRLAAGLRRHPDAGKAD